MRVRVELDCWLEVEADTPAEARAEAQKLLDEGYSVDVDSVIGGRVVEVEELAPD